MVFGIVSSLAGLIKVRYLTDKAVIDNAISRLHYKFTASILFLGCLLCTANSYIGNPIECIVENEDLQNVINTYCWVTSTFTVPGAHRYGVQGIHSAAPGVGHYSNTKDEVRHNYYQWVPFMLFFQGLLFYAPHWFWKNWEDGKVRMISDGLRGTVAESREERKTRISRLVRYYVDSMYLHNWYAVGYFLCEIFNFINVIGNIYLTDKFLGGKFLTYGLDVMAERNNTQISAYEEVFPRVTKCTFFKYGASGTIQKHDHMCILALNIINEKIYIFLWWWFIMLSILTSFMLMYTIAVMLSTSIRSLVLFRRFKYRVSDGVQTIVSRTGASDFFLLHLLGQNINMLIFEELLEELSIKLRGYYPSNAVTMERAPIYPNKEKILPE